MAPPIAYAGQDRAVCTGTPIHLQASVLNAYPGANYGFEWRPQEGLVNPNSPQPFLFVHQTRTYTLRVRDNTTWCNSQNEATVTITALPIPTVEAGDDVFICPGESVRLSAAAAGGAGPYAYEWTPTTGLSNPTSPEPTASPSHSTRYSVRVVSRGCVSETDELWVYVKPTPTVALDNVVSFCPGDSVALESLVTGRDDYVYQWEPKTGLRFRDGQTWAAPDTTTVYTLTVSAPNCSQTHRDSVRVVRLSAPTTVIFGEKTRYICPGETLRFNAHSDALRYEWLPKAGLTQPFRLNTEAHPAQTTTYTLVSYGGQCASRDSVTVVVVDISQIELAAEPDGAICAGRTVYLSARSIHAGFSPQWIWHSSSGEIHEGDRWTLTAQNSGEYTAIARFGDRCEVRKTLELRVFPAPTARFDLSVPEGCSPLRIAGFDRSDGAVESRWHFGEGDWTTQSEHIYERPGRYAVRLAVAGPGECKDTAWAEVRVRAAADDLSFPVVVAQADTLFLPLARVCFKDTNSNVSQIVWDAGDGTVYRAREACHEFTFPGCYTTTVRRTDDGGCVHEDTLRNIVVFAPELDIPNIFTPDGDGINDRFKPVYNGAEKYRCLLTDRWGNILYRGDERSSGWDGLDAKGKPAPEGVYFYVVVFDEKRVYNGSVSLMRR
ncbi:MAG: PKD domain-containing protein [Bacteroidia bacterium]|nr:PKD domain-containing protein [Bacteroidia bacterium]